jgi:NAD(P)-dependent dehydrogenase (short-subunit alcohol dehydrogenase family)
MPLSGRTIIVTGAGRGIGAAIARQCAADGAAIILVARTESELEDTKKTLIGTSHRTYCLDVSDRGAIGSFFEFLTQASVSVDGLVNCAGIQGPIGALHNISLDELEKTFAVNTIGTIALCAGVLPFFIRLGKGKIINVSGGGATSPFPWYSAYAASKAAVVRFTENLAEEYRDMSIGVNAIAPGFVATRIHEATLQAGERAGKDYYEATQRKLENGAVPPECAARLTSFLLSDAAHGITGKLLSAQWDPWEDIDFQERLRAEKKFCTLRRIDHKYYYEK